MNSQSFFIFLFMKGGEYMNVVKRIEAEQRKRVFISKLMALEEENKKKIFKFHKMKISYTQLEESTGISLGTIHGDIEATILKAELCNNRIEEAIETLRNGEVENIDKIMAVIDSNQRDFEIMISLINRNIEEYKKTVEKNK